MQNVSERFNTEIRQPSREIKSRITFPDLVLDDYQVRSINLDSLLVGSDDFEIGTAPMDMIKVELVEDTEAEWGRNLILNSNIENAHAEDEERTATFSRSSIAYLSDGTQVAENEPRFEPGKFGKAIMVEEGTTNRVADPLGLTRWRVNSDVTVLANDGTYNPSTAKFARVSTSLWGAGLASVPSSPGDVWSFRFIARPGTSNGVISAAIMICDSSSRHIDNALPTVRKIADLPNGWGVYVGENVVISNPSTAYVVLRFYNAGQTTGYHDYALPQMEKLAYTTTFTDSTRSPETLTIPTAGVLNPQEGTIEFWVKPLVVANCNNFFNMQTSNGRFLLFFSANLYRVSFDYGAINSGVKSSANTITTNNWHHIVLRWSATTGKQALFVNGVKYEKNLPNGVATSFPETVSIVNNYSAYIDDLRISSIARSDEEILAAYRSGQSLPVDEWTTWKADFENSLRPSKSLQRDLSMSLVEGQEYMFSLTSSGKVSARIYSEDDKSDYIYADKGTTAIKFVPENTGEYTVELYSGVDGTEAKAKLEYGNKATDWTPAPEDYANYDYKNKECDIELGLTLPDESVEYVSIGKFTVENAVRKNNRITLDCIDRMYKAEKEYISDLMYPTTLLDILQSASEQAGIPLATTTFANSDYIVPNEPVYEGVTCRKVFAQVAELAGGYAKVNSLGQLEIITLGDEAVRDITKDHYFDLKINEVAEASIDKVIVKVGEETATKGDGENIYTIVDNMFVQDPNNVVDALYSVLKNVSYTACTLKWQGDFSLDLGDKIIIDGYETYILNRKLTYTGGLREDYTAPAKSNIEKQSTGKGSLTLDIENVKTQVKVLSGEISQTIERVENLVVGANNRLYDSQTGIEFGFNNGVGTVQLFRDQVHPYYKVTSNQNVSLFAAFPDSQFAESLGELGEVTISLEVLVEVDRKVNIDGKEFDVKGNRWTRIHVTKEFNEENTTKRLRVRNPFSRKHTRDTEIGTMLIESLSTNINTFYYRNLKVERGNVVTEWTLTPEELEQYVNRLSTEFKQLEDSISLVARRNELTGRFEVTPESIVAAINTTDGVGKVKTVGVTINENGLTVEDGAVIIRDAFNTAIITSNGLKVMYSFSSGGQYQGWQVVGIWGVGVPVIYSYEASMPVQIPEKLIIEKATLYAHCAPAYLTGYSNVPDGLYYPQNLALYVRDFDATVFDCPMQSSYGVWYGSGGLEISNAVWGGRWTPNGEGVITKSGNVKNYLTPGERSVFVVQSTDSPTSSNGMRFGIMKFDLVIEGFLRG